MASEALPGSGNPSLDIILWQKQEILRIESLSGSEVLSELRQIMCGCNYSWYSINQLLQEKLEDGKLEFTFVDGDILFEWNNLCDEKRLWDRKGHLSQNCAEFNEDCLINLKILPFQASLGHQGLPLVTKNMDKPNLSTADLWVGFDERELKLRSDNESECTSDDEQWEEGSEDSGDMDIEYSYEEEQIDTGFGSDEDQENEVDFEEEQIDSGFESEGYKEEEEAEIESEVESDED